MKYPSMREELINYLKGLSDLDYQKKCWILNDCPIGVEYDELDLAIHFLFDDTQLATDPEALIGDLLIDKMEAESIKLVCDALNKLFEKYGLYKTDEEYINFVEWSDVVESASKTLSLMEIKVDKIT